MKILFRYPNRVNLFGGICNPPDCYSLDDEFCPATCYPPCNLRTMESSINRSKPLIFPNPSLGSLSISNISKGDKISILNVMGEIIISESSLDSFISLDTQKLSAGIYFINVNGKPTDKFIKLN